MNTQKLKAKIIEKGETQQEVAKKIGIDKTTFYRKLNTDCGNNFSIREVKKISDVLGLTKNEAVEIFLN